MLRLTTALAAAALLVACASDDSEPSAESTPPSSPPASTATPEATEPTEPTSPAPAPSPEDDVEAAYRTYVKAFLTGDGATAYDLLSAQCQESSTLSEFAAVSEQAADVYGLVDYTIDGIEIDGDRATVDAEYAVEALNQGGGSVWLLEDGEWRSDKCG